MRSPIRSGVDHGRGFPSMIMVEASHLPFVVELILDELPIYVMGGIRGVGVSPHDWVGIMGFEGVGVWLIGGLRYDWSQTALWMQVYHLRLAKQHLYTLSLARSFTGLLV